MGLMRVAASLRPKPGLLALSAGLLPLAIAWPILSGEVNSALDHSGHLSKSALETEVARALAAKAEHEARELEEFLSVTGQRLVTLSSSRMFVDATREMAMSVQAPDRTPGVSAGDRLHELVYSDARELANLYGFEDLVLVDGEGGRVLYSGSKELASGTLLSQGPWANSGLSKAIRRALQTRSPQQVTLTDLVEHTPSFAEPAMFMAAPVFDTGRPIGVAIVRLGSGALAGVLHKRGKLADAVRTHVLGPDFRPRGQSRAGSVVAVLADKVVEAPALRKALAGSPGVAQYESPAGEAVLGAFVPVKVGDMTWALVAEVDQAKAFATLAKLQAEQSEIAARLERIMLAAGVAIAVLLAVLLLGLGLPLTRPLASIRMALSELAEGNLSEKLELGANEQHAAIATAYNRATAAMRGAFGCDRIDWQEVSHYFVDMRPALDSAMAVSESLPINLFLAKPDLELVYCNPAAVRALNHFSERLPAAPDDMVGCRVDFLFEAAPLLLERLKDPSALPFREVVEVRGDKVQLDAAAVRDAKGAYIGPLLIWEVVTQQLAVQSEAAAARERERSQAAAVYSDVDAILRFVNAALQGDLTQPVPATNDGAIGKVASRLDSLFAILRQNFTQIGDTAQSVASACEQLGAVAQELWANARQSTDQSGKVSSSADLVSASVENVAAASEEMSVSIVEISDNAGRAATVASDAVKLASSTNDTVRQLSESSSGIDNIVKVITSIAEQTNLLALNATIEAARAGDAGRGFAVVANEVKELAKETARATDEIGGKISAIQSDSEQAVRAISQISEIIGDINEIQSTIATAVQEQSTVTNEISRTVAEAARSNNEIASNITLVAERNQDALNSAQLTRTAVDDLERLSEHLMEMLRKFKYA